MSLDQFDVTEELVIYLRQELRETRDCAQHFADEAYMLAQRLNAVEVLWETRNHQPEAIAR